VREMCEWKLSVAYEKLSKIHISYFYLRVKTILNLSIISKKIIFFVQKTERLIFCKI
jgi:hypothetical protein